MINNICSYARIAALLTLIVFALTLAIGAQGPTTFVVNTTDDINHGSCLTDPGGCSLRDAINAANDDGNFPTIDFDIPLVMARNNAPSAVMTIMPRTLLPQITTPVFIDGYSQPGASPNTLPVGDNAVILIEISGALEGSGDRPDLVPLFDGLVLAPKSVGSTIRGLVINRFTGNGISIQSNNNEIAGNFIGTDATGTTTVDVNGALGNGIGIQIGENLSGNEIGCTFAEMRNVISGNLGDGVSILTAPFFFRTQSSFVRGPNLVEGNYIGTDLSGTLLVDADNNPLGNGDAGVSVFEPFVLARPARKARVAFFSATNIIGAGGAPVGRPLLRSRRPDDAIPSPPGNIIAGNAGVGVSIVGFDNVGNLISQNSIFSNGGLGIDLDNGFVPTRPSQPLPGTVTPNDFMDGDNGANTLQNFPVITSAKADGPNGTIDGTLNSTPGSQFTIEFFSSPSCNDVAPNDYGEGQTFITSIITDTTDVNGDLSFSLSELSLIAGQYLTATATDEFGDTSEFSQCKLITSVGIPTTMSITSSANPSVFGQPVTFTATVADLLPPPIAAKNAAAAPSDGTPTGAVNFFENFTPIPGCQNVTVDGSGHAVCLTSTLYVGNHIITANYTPTGPFLASSGSMTGNPQVVGKAATTTTITNAAGLSSTPTGIGQTYAVNWSVTVNPLGSGTPTGTVTVTTDGPSPTSCFAAVAVGTCNLTSTTVGFKTITVTYSGDGNFFGSSASASHTVNLTISGNIQQYVPGGPNTNLPGVTVTLTFNNINTSMTDPSTNSISTTTDASGNYSFAVTFPGNFIVTPTMNGKVFEPISRSLTNVTNNVPGVNFIAFNNPGGIPRDLRVVTSFVAPGQTVSIPIVLDSLGNERFLSFSITYDTNLFTAPSAACGSSAPGCTITTAGGGGVFGVTVTPAAVFNAGPREVARIMLTSFATNLPNTPINFGDNPVVKIVRDAANDPLPSGYLNGLVIFAQGLEGDVTPRAPQRRVTGEALGSAGDGVVDATDVVEVRRFVVGLDMPNLTVDEFQRADTSPRAVSGDGVIDSTDVTQERRYATGLDPLQPAGGPGTTPAPPLGPGAIEAGREIPTDREMTLDSVAASPGGKARVSVDLRGQGSESAASFTLGFDPSKLSDPVISLGAGAPASAVLTTNLKQAADGRVAVLVDSAEAFVGREVVTVTFDVSASATGGDTLLAFTNDLAVRSTSDTEANPLATKYTDGALKISGPAFAGYEISGRVLVSNGQGLRNATVTLTDASGNVRTAVTSTFGYFSFDNVAAGDGYVLKVESKRYVFEPRVVQIAGNLTGLDLTPR